MKALATVPLNFIRGRKKRPAGPDELPRQPKPEWLKVRAPGSENYHRLKGLMRGLGLHTVCEEANCPNIGECWHHGTATFMILGSTCTRSCGYCNVTHGAPLAPDDQEPIKVASAIHALELSYVVVTSVDRDDLPDFGASHFARTIAETRARIPACRLEVLIPDLGPVDGGLFIGGGVEDAADAFDGLGDELGGGVAGGALEEHVLDEVRDALLGLGFVAGAHAEEEGDGGGTGVRHGGDQDAEAVGEDVADVGEGLEACRHMEGVYVGSRFALPPRPP